MKISELILILKSIKHNHGDLDIWLSSDMGEYSLDLNDINVIHSNHIDVLLLN